MKTKQLLTFLLAITFLYACNTKSNTSTETTPATTETQKKAEAPYVYGIDISSYQGDETDFLNKHKDSLGFVFCKATQGATYVDPDFKTNWSTIKSDGFLRGAYHFYMSSDDPSSQATNFTTTIQGIESTDIAPVIDFESGGIDSTQTIQEVVNGLTQFINAVEKKLGRKPMIYTDIPTADKYLTDSSFSSYALWVANYNGKDQPDLPTTWSQAGWTFWQRGDDYKIVNFTNDSDVYNGDISKLKDFIKNYN